MHLSYFLWFNSLFAWHFLKKVLFARMGSTILKNDFEYFRSNISLFDPQTASKWSDFVIIARSSCSVARSVRYVFASCPLQKQPVARLPCCFRLQAPLAKTMVCIVLAILWISYAICCSLYAFHALHTRFFNLFVIFFWKNSSRLRWEAWFSKMHECKIMPKTAS